MSRSSAQTCLHYTPNVGILLPPAQLPIPVRTQSQSTALRRQSGLGALCWNSRSDEPTLSPFTWPALLLHFGTHAHTSPSESRVLRLYDHLSVGQHFDMSTVNFQLGLSLDDVLPYFRPVQWSLTRTIPQGLSLHPSAEILRHLAKFPLPVLHTPDHQPWEAIEVFTDGSFDGCRSSWAFLVIGWRRGACHVIGWCAGPVVTDSTAVLHIGAESHDAFRGELSALFWALAWLAQGARGDLRSDLV